MAPGTIFSPTCATLGGGTFSQLYGTNRPKQPPGQILVHYSMDVIRTLRATRISSEHRIEQAVRAGDTPEARVDAPSGRSIRKALRNRLALAIMDDWRAAAGRTSGAHGKGDTDGRARRGRPRGQTEFVQRWGSVAEVEAGVCTPRTRWIETDRPPD